MVALRRAAALAMLVGAAPAAASPVDRWAPHIASASARFGVPAGWIRRVMAAESGGRTVLDGRPIVSRAGAMGLMQLMPATWRDVRATLRLGYDPHDPADNIMAGTFYLRRMYDRFGYPGLFGAYNAGPGRYASSLSGTQRLPAETRRYIMKVTGPALRSPSRAPAPSTLFVVTQRARARPVSGLKPQAPAGLFVPLHGAADRSPNVKGERAGS